ncbi:nickel/cobalt transporter [Streptomyces sp. NPDC059828]|uniref:nickel/cobalt transporter n=1 Tax=Streptomyces sp. NPDC059828 TaxID=3346965 RepID=UPI00365ECA36
MNFPTRGTGVIAGAGCMSPTYAVGSGVPAREPGTVGLRRPLARAAAVLGLVLAALFTGGTTPAMAHPLGNFTVNRFDGLVLHAGELTVDHVEDLAEIPTARVRPKELPASGLAAWATERCAEAARTSQLRVDGRVLPLKAGPARAEVRPGQAGLPTLRLECGMTAPLPERAAAVVFRAAGADGPGWREITARGDRRTLKSSSVPRDSVSNRLSSYPDGLLDSPPNRTTAEVTAVPGGPALAEDGTETAAPASILPRGVDRWTQQLTGLVEHRELTPPFAALALAVALGLGALHALAPGHGKTLMAAAAAVGGRSSLRDVLTLAASVTVTHTLGVFALGALVATGAAVSPSVVGWLGVASGCLVTVAGALLVRRAWQQRASGHGHTHVHWVGGRAYSHSHDDGHGHAHSRDRHEAPAGGHDHGHGTAHDHSREHAHDHARPHGHGHGHAGPHGHGHDHPHGHDHGAHVHAPASAPSQPLRRTVLLGFAGGLVPSPSAVVVLVGATALGHAWFGLLLVVAYGAGLALTLTAAGFAVVRLGRRAAAWLDRRRAASRTSGRFLGFVQRTAPLSTALAVLVLGCGLVFRGAVGAIS